MKPHHHQSTGNPSNVTPPRRYPSLSDDGQPWFPRDRWARRPVAAALFEGNRSGNLWLSVLAALWLIAIFAALAASA